MERDKRKIIKKFVKERACGYWYKLECLFCGREFEISGYIFNSGTGKFCSKKCYGGYNMTGRNINCKVCKKSFYVTKSKKSKYCSQECMRIAYQNEGNPSWNGGTAKQRRSLRTNIQHMSVYKIWRKSVFERDKYTCQKCGQVGGFLEADHIKRWSLYPKLRFNVNNGQTLCKLCHRLKTKIDKDIPREGHGHRDMWPPPEHYDTIINSFNKDTWDKI